MVHNTIMDSKDTNQRCCSHCNKVHAYNSHRNTREKRAPHCRSDRQSPPKLNNDRRHCLDATNTASTTSGPSDATKTNIHLQPDTASNTSLHQQVSHLTSHNTASSIETNLITDTALDGHTAFHTTLQVITSQGCKNLQAKVDPGADCSTIPLSHFRSAFPKHFTKSGALKKNALQPTYATWSAHDGQRKHFSGYLVLNIQHKTTPQILPIKFYVFEDHTSPDILLSYAASSRLGIVQFTVPNETPVNYPLWISAIERNKRVTFHQHLEDKPQYPHNNSDNTPKPIIKKPSQDHTSTGTLQDSHFSPFQDHKSSTAPFQDHKSHTNHVSQDHLSIDSVIDIIALKNAFPNSFDTTGNMPGQYTIKLDTSIHPVQHARRKVPIEAREEIEKALQKMVDNEIITPVTEPTEWVSSLTYPRKSDGSICPCLDPRDLNKAIIREHYKAPTLEEISHKLSGATVFSKLDAKDGFWSIHLDTPSSYLTTFNTHKGRYRYLRMPFGLKMSQDVFQMCMDQITDRLPGIIAIHDDICIYGKTREEHDTNLLELMKTASKNGLVFNSHKCSIRQPQITFYGAIFTSQGMKPDPTKIQALQDLPKPDNHKQLQSFLGLINYLQPFLPGLASKTTFLREQISSWDWNPSTDIAFQKLKHWICKTLLNTTLAYFDRTKPVVIQTDASEYGLGAALLQDGRPIAFASKTLTDVETRYANIERECLSVCFGLEKFHTYVYGCHITVQNDHKPLEMIQKKPIHAAPPRLQRMLLRLQKYDYTIVYRPGKEMVLADRLSRFPSRKEHMPIELHQNIHSIQLEPDRLNIVRGAIERDPIHSTAYSLTLNGWPDKIHEVPRIVRQFWGTRDELTVENGILLKGDRVCIPPELYDRMLSDLHGNHRGIEKMRHLSQHTIYWPGLDADIADYVNRCKTCTQHKAKQAVQPMLPRDVPDSPWQELAADFFTHNHKEYLLIADTFSKYPFVYQMSSKTAESISKKLQNLISQYGPPKRPLFR